MIASCERRVQGSGDEQDSRLLQLAVKLLLAPPATPHNLTGAAAHSMSACMQNGPIISQQCSSSVLLHRAWADARLP